MRPREPFFIMMCLTSAVFSVAAMPAMSGEVSWEWDWTLSANDVTHQDSLLIAERESAHSKNIDAVIDVELKTGGVSALIALKGDKLYTNEYGQSFDSELVIQELFWQGTPSYIDAPMDITLGKVRLDWGVGYGYRPLDLFKPYRRNPVGIQVEEGAGGAMASYFDEAGEWSLIYSDSSWNSQSMSALEQVNEQQGVGLRRYVLSGDSEWQAIGYYDNVRHGVVGGSFVTVLNSAWAVHTSAAYQRYFNAFEIYQANTPVALEKQKGGHQMLAGLNWANEVGNNVIVEYWYDNRSWHKSEWETAFNRVETLSEPISSYGLEASYAQGLGHANLVAHNVMLHWSLDSTSWSQWEWSKQQLWLNSVTPTFDLLYSPQDGGVIATQWIDVSAYDSGDASLNVELAARFLGGNKQSVYANLGDKRMIFINLKGKF